MSLADVHILQNMPIQKILAKPRRDKAEGNALRQHYLFTRLNVETSAGLRMGHSSLSCCSAFKALKLQRH